MGGTSELGEKVVLLYDGGKDVVVRFAEALVPGSSSLNRVVCGLPWEDATVKERATGELVHFKDDSDVSQVSIIVLKCEVLASACAQVAHHIFEFLSTSASIHASNFTFIVPVVSRIPGSVMKVDTDNNKAAIFTAFLNSASENDKWRTGYLPKLPPTFPIRDPFLAYLFHFVHATGLPTVLLVAPSNHGSVGEKGVGIQVLHMLGDAVAKQAGLTYLKQKLNEAADLPSPMAGVEASVEDDWRRLYI